ncbi:MAG: hypothetical protein HY541_02665 [Deltaproteobacteria bacterium]|nr:hypothetical protein [Deltaproteobacteria bacterium]
MLACSETPQFKNKESDIPASLEHGRIFVENAPVYYVATNQQFPIKQTTDEELCVPSGSGWNYIDVFKTDDAEVALGVSEDVDLAIETADEYNPETSYSPTFHVTSENFVGTLYREGCSVEIPMQLTTRDLDGCGTTPLQSIVDVDYITDSPGFLEMSAIIEDAARYSVDSDCAIAKLLPDNYDDAYVCIGFNINSPDLYQLAVGMYPDFASQWDQE